MKSINEYFSGFILLCFAIALSGCGNVVTKMEAFPEMYDPEVQPLSILVVPAINESTNVEATDFYSVTIAEPLSYLGYYVFPLEIVTDILRNEGIVDTAQIRNLPAEAFAQGFGADAVLYVTISSWEKNYIIIAGNVEVGLEFVMVSTKTGGVVWSYSSTVVVDTTGDTGFIISNIISTAITTALTDSLPVAKQANQLALMSLPVGQYHPNHGLDGDENGVNTDLQAAALETE